MSAWLLTLTLACGTAPLPRSASAEGPGDLAPTTSGSTPNAPTSLAPVEAQATARAQATAAALGLPSTSLAPLVDRLTPSVVSVKVQKAAPGATRIFAPGGAAAGEGSGFVLSADGEILTNHHVIQGASAVEVVFADGRSLPAQVVGSDDRTDVALLRVQATGLPALSLGDSASLRVGDWVLAIGNPFGLGHTVTAGIVSGKGRALGAGPYDDFLQTDAAINPGNSGGPLFDLEGRVVGMNTAIIQQANGIGFAIPVDLIAGLLEDLRTEGRVSRGWLGVSSGDGPDGAVVVAQVFEGTPAARAGLRPGDEVLAVGGQAVADSAGLVRTIGTFRAGEQVELELRRGGRLERVTVTLEERPPERTLR